jgi:holliday junction DNA helicase RuvA
MIGSVRGTVLDRSPSGEVVIEVGGVGYRALVPLGALTTLEPGSPAFLFTHLHVRDDAMVLFGFPSRDERDTFEALIGVNGVGPKLALGILSVHSPGGLRRALADEDLDALTLVPSVGKRTAQRLMIELQARLEVPAVGAVDGSADGGTSARPAVREALAGLGYAPEEIRDVMARLPDDGSVEELLREALRTLATVEVTR